MRAAMMVIIFCGAWVPAIAFAVGAVLALRMGDWCAMAIFGITVLFISLIGAPATWLVWTI